MINNSASKKALLKLPELIQPSLISPIKRKIVKTEIIWTRWYITLVKLSATTIKKGSFCKVLLETYKKLVLILIIFTPMTKASKEN